MIRKTLFALVWIAAGAAAGWYASGWSGSGPAAQGGARPLFYQSPMHPHIKSDKPGQCTICGMDLVPIYDEAKAFKADTSTIMLPESAVTASRIVSAPVARAPLRRTLRVAGTIEDNDTRHRILAARSGGRIEALHVNYVGAEVSAGEPLATWYSPALLALAREYAVAVKAAPEGPLAASAARRLGQMGLSPAQIAALPARSPDEQTFDIAAPADGTVVARGAYEGQYVEEGATLFEIGDFSTMWFQFAAYERDLAWLKTGQEVEVTTPAAPGRVFRAPVVFIDPNIDLETRSARVRVELANPRETAPDGSVRRPLPHRAYAEGRVTAELGEVVLVPRAAVLWTGRGARVFVEESPGSYTLTPVRLGREGDDGWEVLEGLYPGEDVVTQGNVVLDGQSQIGGGS